MKTQTTTKKQTVLYLSQYGDKFYATTLKELREQVRGRCSIMCNETEYGEVYRAGYVIGELWLMAYVPLIKAIS